MIANPKVIPWSSPVLATLEGVRTVCASTRAQPAAMRPEDVRVLSSCQFDQPCSFTRFLDELGNPPPALAGGPPQTIRALVGSRQFGDFGTVLMAEKPASADLSAHVARWRATDRARRDDLPLRAHPDQTADSRRLEFALAVTAGTLGGWIILGVIAAAIAGKL